MNEKIPAYILERSEEASKYEKPYSFDCQILDYIRWQDKTIEDMRNKINKLETELDEAKGEITNLRLSIHKSL